MLALRHQEPAPLKEENNSCTSCIFFFFCIESGLPLLLYRRPSACWGMATFNCLLLTSKIIALKMEGYYPLTISLNHPVSILCIPIKNRAWQGLNSLSKGLAYQLTFFFFFWWKSWFFKASINLQFFWHPSQVLDYHRMLII